MRNIICNNCTKKNYCCIFNNLYKMSDCFSINNCRYYVEKDTNKYKKISQNDDLMRLIYDYFMNCVEGNYTEAEIKEVIVSELKDL